MSTAQTLTNGIANADAIVATQEALVTPELSLAELKAQITKLKADKDAAEERQKLELEQIKLKADALLAAATKSGKGKEKPKNTAKPTPDGDPAVRRATKLASSIAKALELGQVQLPTDVSLGVINPANHTPADKLFLTMLAKERTKEEKLADAANVPGTYQRAVFSFFNQLGYSQDWTNAFLKKALERNVVSKMFIRTTQGKMVLWFDTAWRPNLKGMEYERMTPAEITAFQAIFGKE